MIRLTRGIITAALALGITGCASVAEGPPRAAHKPPATVWHVGRFTVREVSLPAVATADEFPNLGPYALSGGFTLARVSTSPPYTVSRTDLTTHSVTSLGTVPCAQQPYFAQTVGRGTVLFCPGGVGSALNSLLLIGQTGPMTALGLPVRIPVPANRLQVIAQEFNGYVEWTVLLNSEPPVLYGRGMIDIATGRNEPIPRSVKYPPGTAQVKPGTAMGPGSSSSDVFVGPGDLLYDAVMTEGSSQEKIYTWSATQGAWTDLGTLFPGTFPFGSPALAPDGSAWWIRPKPTAGIPYDWHVVRTVIGTSKVRTWRVHGDMLGVGPGFFAYLPFQNPGELVIDFPLLGKLLTFSDLGALPGPPYFLDQAAQMGTEWSTLTDTQVIYMGVGSKEKVLLITP